MSGIFMSGVGTPTRTTVPARSRASNACFHVSGRPTASMTTSAPYPSVSAWIASTGSVDDELTTSVAPSLRAPSSFRSSMSTTMIFDAPARADPTTAALPTPPQPMIATVLPR